MVVFALSRCPCLHTLLASQFHWVSLGWASVAQDRSSTCLNDAWRLFSAPSDFLPTYQMPVF